MGRKICAKCVRRLAASSFARRSQESRDGRQSYCRDCNARTAKAWRIRRAV
jgi:hypothetical protein